MTVHPALPCLGYQGPTRFHEPTGLAHFGLIRLRLPQGGGEGGKIHAGGDSKSGAAWQALPGCLPEFSCRLFGNPEKVFRQKPIQGIDYANTECLTRLESHSTIPCEIRRIFCFLNKQLFIPKNGRPVLESEMAGPHGAARFLIKPDQWFTKGAGLTAVPGLLFLRLKIDTLN